METDKATMEVESPDDGIIAKILVPAGTAKTAVNSLVAVMVEPGENPAEVEMPTDTAPAAPAPAAAPAAPAPAAAAPAAAPAASASSAGSGSGATTQDTLLPAVKNLVAMHSLDPAVIPATGPKGHLLKGDVLRFLETGEAVSAAATAGQAHAHGAGAGAGAAADAEYVDIELTNMRKIIAARLTESKQTIPHTYASVEVNLDKINAMRKALAEQGTKVSVNDFIVRAAGRALREVPQGTVPDVH
jgi:pyruvate/2-oxoglutarate dehydrogenase complex dihydrolipoamide acyltransferase (E2) component